jgi:hypothetical protein
MYRVRPKVRTKSSEKPKAGSPKSVTTRMVARWKGQSMIGGKEAIQAGTVAMKARAMTMRGRGDGTRSDGMGGGDLGGTVRERSPTHTAVFGGPSCSALWPFSSTAAAPAGWRCEILPARPSD